MSAQREELLRLLRSCPRPRCPAVLDDVRRHLRGVKQILAFGLVRRQLGRTSDATARSQDLLDDGFGHPA